MGRVSGWLGRNTTIPGTGFDSLFRPCELCKPWPRTLAILAAAGAASLYGARLGGSPKAKRLHYDDSRCILLLGRSEVRLKLLQMSRMVGIRSM